MNKPVPASGQTGDQREALERSEKNAAKKQPRNYKEDATDDKVVEIGPDKDDAPIRGIDPAGDAENRKP
jgi:hypothetical protein